MLCSAPATSCDEAVHGVGVGGVWGGGGWGYTEGAEQAWPLRTNELTRSLTNFHGLLLLRFVGLWEEKGWGWGVGGGANHDFHY